MPPANKKKKKEEEEEEEEEEEMEKLFTQGFLLISWDYMSEMNQIMVPVNICGAWGQN
jgi:hypothetical protein